MKLLKRLILFTLASEQDFFIKSEGYGYYPYAQLYGRLMPYQESSIRDGVLQLVESQAVDKIVRNGVPIFRLTSRGRDRLLSFYTISIGQKKVWDGIWRIALLEPASSIQHPASRRRMEKLATGNWQLAANKNDLNELRKLKRGLSKMGFRQFSRGVYVSALPISAKLREYLLSTSAGSKITVIESRQILVGDNRQLAEKLWHLNLLEEAYRDLITRMGFLLKQIKYKKILNYQTKKEFSAILLTYFSLLEKDPGLPKKLLRSDWPLDLAKEQFARLVAIFKELEANFTT